MFYEHENYEINDIVSYNSILFEINPMNYIKEEEV